MNQPLENDPFIMNAVIVLALVFTTIAFIATLIDHYWWKPSLVRKARAKGKPVPLRHRQTNWGMWGIAICALSTTFFAMLNREFLLKTDFGPLNPILEQLLK